MAMQYEVHVATGLLAGVRQVASPHQDERPAGMAVDLIVLHGISLPPGEFGGPWIDRLFTGSLPLVEPSQRAIARPHADGSPHLPRVFADALFRRPVCILDAHAGGRRHCVVRLGPLRQESSPAQSKPENPDGRDREQRQRATRTLLLEWHLLGSVQRRGPRCVRPALAPESRRVAALALRGPWSQLGLGEVWLQRFELTQHARRVGWAVHWVALQHPVDEIAKPEREIRPQLGEPWRAVARHPHQHVEHLFFVENCSPRETAK